ncbi:MAG: hypothetical protein JWR10_2447 [Rubritepida sp.]|nr:hypothetical protein [Rubritepida sp.]
MMRHAVLAGVSLTVMLGFVVTADLQKIRTP